MDARPERQVRAWVALQVQRIGLREYCGVAVSGPHDDPHAVPRPDGLPAHFEVIPHNAAAVLDGRVVAEKLLDSAPLDAVFCP